MIAAILYVIATIILSQIISGLLHIYCKIVEKKYSWVNYLATGIIMLILVIVYELIIEPISGWMVGLFL